MAKLGGLIDLVIPTMWRAPIILDSLEVYASSDSIGKIILVDNDSSRRPELEEFIFNRLTIIDHGHNVYVNPAWNAGVALCDSEVIGIVNDDILIDDQFFEVIKLLDWSSRGGIDIIGLGRSEAIEGVEISRVSISKDKALGSQVQTFGAGMFMPRKNYKTIPEQLKIWFGDDYLVHANPNTFVAKSSFIAGTMSGTIRALGKDSEIPALIRQDIKWAEANLLESLSPQSHDSIKVPNLMKSKAAHKTLSLDLGSGETPRNPFRAEKVIGMDSQCVSGDIISCWIGFNFRLNLFIYFCNFSVISSAFPIFKYFTY